MAGAVVGGWLDGRPGRRPQRIDAVRLVSDVRDLGDVAALGEDSDAQGVVLNGNGAAAAVSGFWHIRVIIMHSWMERVAAVLLVALAAPPFWESKPAREWTDAQVKELLT